MVYSKPSYPADLPGNIQLKYKFTVVLAFVGFTSVSCGWGVNYFAGGLDYYAGPWLVGPKATEGLVSRTRRPNRYGTDGLYVAYSCEFPDRALIRVIRKDGFRSLAVRVRKKRCRQPSKVTLRLSQAAADLLEIPASTPVPCRFEIEEPYPGMTDEAKRRVL